MIREHHAAHFMALFDEGAFPGESHLNGSRAPWDERSQMSFSDALQRFMNLCWVDITLDDIEDRDIKALSSPTTHHYVFAL